MYGDEPSLESRDRPTDADSHTDADSVADRPTVFAGGPVADVSVRCSEYRECTGGDWSDGYR